MAFCHTAPGSEPLQRRTLVEASLTPLLAAVALGHASFPVQTCRSPERVQRASLAIGLAGHHGRAFQPVSVYERSLVTQCKLNPLLRMRQTEHVGLEQYACRSSRIPISVPCVEMANCHSLQISCALPHLSTGRLHSCRIVGLLHVLKPESVEDGSTVRRPRQLHRLRAVCVPTIRVRLVLICCALVSAKPV